MRLTWRLNEDSWGKERSLPNEFPKDSRAGEKNFRSRDTDPGIIQFIVQLYPVQLYCVLV